MKLKTKNTEITIQRAREYISLLHLDYYRRKDFSDLVIKMGDYYSKDQNTNQFTRCLKQKN